MGDSGDFSQKKVFSLKVMDVKVEVHNVTEKYFRPDVKDDNNDHQEVGCHDLSSKFSNQTNSERLDIPGTSHMEDAEGPKQSENVATLCMSRTMSTFEASEDPDLELDTAGIDLLASVAISESSSNDETVSAVIFNRSLSTSEGDMVSEPQDMTVGKDEIVDSLPTADRSKIAKRQEFDGTQCTLSSVTETQARQDYKGVEKPTAHEESSRGFQSEKGPVKNEDSAAITASHDVSAGPTVDLSQADDCSSYLVVPFINESHGRNLVVPEFKTSISKFQDYSGNMDQEQKDANTADAGQDMLRGKDIELRQFNASMNVDCRDVIEVVLEVAKSEEDGKILHHRCTVTKESTEDVSVSEHPFRIAEGLENQQSSSNFVNCSPSVTLLFQPSTCGTSLDEKLDKKREKCIDEKKVDQVMVASGAMGIEIQDQNQSKLKMEKATRDNDSAKNFERLDFDLNEGFVEEVSLQDAVSAYALPSMKLISLGPFIRLESSIQSKEEHGWESSTAKISFCPAEGDHIVQMIHSLSEDDAISFQSLKSSRELLNIDLNIADEQTLEEAGMNVQFFSDLNVLGTQTPIKMNDMNSSCKFGTSSQNKRPTLDLNRIHELEEGKSVPGSSAEADEDMVLQVNSSKQAFQRCKNSKLALDLNGIPVIEISDEPTPPSRTARFLSGVSVSAIVGQKMAWDKRNDFSWSEQARSTYPKSTIFPAFASTRTGSTYAAATAGSSTSSFPGDSCNSVSSFASTVDDNPQERSFAYGRHSFACNYAAFPSASVQLAESSRSRSLTAIPLHVLSSASVVPSYTRNSQAMGMKEVTRSTGKGVWTRSSDLIASPDVHEMAKVREDLLKARQLSGGIGSIGGSKRPYHQIMEVLEGPVGRERFKKLKEMEAAAWAMQKGVMPILKQHTWR